MVAIMISRIGFRCGLLRLGVSLLAGVGLFACEDDGAPGVCSYGGQSYAAGDTFPSTDGCNSCFCSADGLVGCTLRACVDGGPPGADAAGPVTCTYGGQTHAPGAVFPATDGCNSCHCFDDGTVGCSLIACVDASLPTPDAQGQACAYGGKTYPPGARFPSTDGCNDCFCSESGAVGCTKRACLPDAGGICSYGMASYQPGESFPSTDGCNTCQCLPDGSVACTEKACVPMDGGSAPDAAGACALSMSYSYGDIGGLRIYVDRVQLSPPRGFSYTRTPVRGDGPSLSCQPPLPDCGPGPRITAADVERAVAHPQVQAALAENPTPLFGRDNRPADGVVFEFRRQDGETILIGTACRLSAGCREIPPAIRELRELLLELNVQQLADPACAELRR